MIFLLTNVAKTQDVLLDSTIFFGNTVQKDRATIMNKNIPIELSLAFRNIQKSSSTTQFSNETGAPNEDIVQNHLT